jgi:hypothetical protein
MCVKQGITKRLYLVMNFSLYPKYPSIVGVLPNHPLYRQIYEDTKNEPLTAKQMKQLEFQFPQDSLVRMYELQVPPSYILN